MREFEVGDGLGISSTQTMQGDTGSGGREENTLFYKEI